MNFAGNLDRGEDINDNTIMFFIIEEIKETKRSKRTVKVSWMLLYDSACLSKVSHCKFFNWTPYSKIYFALVLYQYKITSKKTLNVKLSNSQLHKLKLVVKNCPEVTLKLLSNDVSDSVDENSSPHKLLLTNTNVFRLRKSFATNSSANKINKISIS